MSAVKDFNVNIWVNRLRIAYTFDYLDGVTDMIRDYDEIQELYRGVAKQFGVELDGPPTGSDYSNGERFYVSFDIGKSTVIPNGAEAGNASFTVALPYNAWSRPFSIQQFELNAWGDGNQFEKVFIDGSVIEKDPTWREN